LTLLALTTIGGAARADAPAGDRRRAAALFDEGRRLVAAGRFDEACTRFAESERLDASPGTLLNLVDCEERAGLLATAFASAQKAERLAAGRGDGESATFAHRRAAEIEPRVPRLRIRVRVAPARVEQVTLDGTVVDPAGGPVPVDAGHHRIEATFTDAPAASAEIDVAPDTRDRQVELAPAPPTMAPPPPPARSPAVETSAEANPREAHGQAGGLRRPIGVAAMATGTAALVVGAVTGLLALSTKNRLVATCTSGGGAFPDRCGGGSLDAAGRADAQSDLATARTDGTISTIGLAAGVVLVAAGIVLYATSGGGAARSAQLCPMGIPCFFSSARR
jgi:hypothetical protein